VVELREKGDDLIALASKRVQELPPINVIERVCALAIKRANRKAEAASRIAPEFYAPQEELLW
jgi:hypothetical protein